MSIEIRDVTKRFGNFTALQPLNLTVATGKLTALLGPSGCGKTTLLRIVAGLECADTGRVLFDGVDVTDTPVQKRHIGFMFQHYALFRHMNVFDNVAFGLRVMPKHKRPNKDEIDKKVNHLLELVQLAHMIKKYPHQLSGGQRQRIALARSLAIEPKLLLLDEPFGALDAKVRKELRAWLKSMHQKLGVTSILVTHDQEEAVELADEIVVMNHGQIEQVGDYKTLKNSPKSHFVASFLQDGYDKIDR
ncbi:ABC sulfate/thiosulfate transporter ATPase subunit CysA [Moraxella macacae 0408225]|uniref:ABC sulfate/thiosulfate transporter ATPase subunit CysA n=1 Tax=Moraxella macacae 0408225 TaxID=1230338 RepID=L2F531_9GAMM|nr:sulfate ABC transporter ATP-binding protein [Moraxella macacae]ELA08117.1 ABC sulfate/thiosulfate transporter ATPase subunit CysA [Moraxella macacae 0408225]